MFKWFFDLFESPEEAPTATTIGGTVPYSKHTHKGYPEIQTSFDGRQHRWIVRIYSYQGAGVELERTSGSEFTPEDARRSAIAERNRLVTKVEK